MAESLTGPRPIFPLYDLSLFVSDSNIPSRRAIDTIQEICEGELAGRCSLEIIDIYEHPERLQSDQIVAVPTLIRKLPKPIRLFIGDLSQKEKVLQGLMMERQN